MEERLHDEAVETPVEVPTETSAEVPATEEKKQYIGMRALAYVNKNEDINRVAVKYEDNQTDEYSVRQFEAMVSDTPYEEGLVQVRKWKPFVKIVLEEMLNDGMKIGEKDYVLGRVDMSIINNYNVLLANLFGANHVENIDIRVIDEAMKGSAYLAYPPKEVEPVNPSDN